MPSVNRLASLRRAARNHPVVVATTAATAGVLLGGFVVVQVLALPKPHAQADDVAQAATTKAEAKAPIETTGSAPSGETVASTECDQQAWPHLTRTCMEEYRNRNRSPRVVSTDKLDKPAVEAVQPASIDEFQLAAPAPWAPSVASPAPLAAPPPVTTASAPPQAADPAPVVAATPAPVATAAEPPAQAAVNTETEKQTAKKSKRKAKAPARQKLDDDERTSVARGDSDDDLSNDRPDRQAERRPDRSHRVVDRRIERDYDVDSEAGGRRRVIVIRRGGGLFENLFGMGRGDDD